jgi:enterochelin esterase-like enzyme
MAGLSLGGMLTGTVGVRHSDLFGWLGIFSGGVVSEPALLRKDTVKLVFETCGSQEYPERIQQNVAQLRDLCFNASTYVSPDTAHEWQTWRRSLYQFLQLIFQ